MTSDRRLLHAEIAEVVVLRSGDVGDLLAKGPHALEIASGRREVVLISRHCFGRGNDFLRLTAQKLCVDLSRGLRGCGAMARPVRNVASAASDLEFHDDLPKRAHQYKRAGWQVKYREVLTDALFSRCDSSSSSGKLQLQEPAYQVLVRPVPVEWRCEPASNLPGRECDHTSPTRGAGGYAPVLAGAVWECFLDSPGRATSPCCRRAGPSERGSLLGAGPAEVVFTSGGTESDNLAIFGSVKSGDHVITQCGRAPRGTPCGAAAGRAGCRGGVSAGEDQGVSACRRGS